MSEYIKREDAYREIMECFKNSEMPEEWENGMHTAGMIILQDVPSADVVEVVRCKDCIHNDQCKHRVVMWVEDPINTWHKDIDFCSYGERKDDEKVRD